MLTIQKSNDKGLAISGHGVPDARNIIIPSHWWHGMLGCCHNFVPIYLIFWMAIQTTEHGSHTCWNYVTQRIYHGSGMPWSSAYQFTSTGDGPDWLYWPFLSFMLDSNILEKNWRWNSYIWRTSWGNFQLENTDFQEWHWNGDKPFTCVASPFEEISWKIPDNNVLKK